MASWDPRQWFAQSQKRSIDFLDAGQLLGLRTAARHSRRAAVTNETALRHSAVWACLRLRANLVSTMPVDLFRRVGDIAVELPKPPVLTNPGGEYCDIGEWLYSTQFDLDREGNCFGLITERDRYNLPARIELLSLADVSVKVDGGEVKYRVGNEVFSRDKVWHEKQYTVAGLDVGLSPVAYAAWSIGEYLSIQDFASEWFDNANMPIAHVRNTQKTLTPPEAQVVKDRYRANIMSGEPFVTGMDYEFKPIEMANQALDWIEGKQYGVADIARFFDCPADLIDAAVAGNNITYANITQRNLQFLIMHLGPAVVRRENALTKLTPKPQFVNLNTDALLRMDPATRAEMIKTQIDSRTLLPSEGRELDNRPPLTDAQIAEFDRLFGAPGAKGAQPMGASKSQGVSQ